MIVVCLLCFIWIASILHEIHTEIQSLHNTLIEIAYNIEDMRGDKE